MEIYAFLFHSFTASAMSRKRKNRQTTTKKRVNFEILKMLIFDKFFLAKREKTKANASKHRLMCVKNISPLPCEGRLSLAFNFAVANVYRLTGCGNIKKLDLNERISE